MNHTKRPCCRYTAGLLLSVAFCPFPSTRGKRLVLAALFMQKTKAAEKSFVGNSNNYHMESDAFPSDSNPR